MADIIDLIRADQLHITRWAVKRRRLSHQAGTRQHRAELITTWETLGRLIELPMRADEEICGPRRHRCYAAAPGDSPGNPGHR